MFFILFYCSYLFIASLLVFCFCFFLEERKGCCFVVVVVVVIVVVVVVVVVVFLFVGNIQYLKQVKSVEWSGFV